MIKKKELNELVNAVLNDPKRIDLSNQNLTSLPQKIFKRRHITTLDASHNKINSLQPDIGLFEDLEELFIIDNKLKYLPPEIGNLENLRILSVYNNQLLELPREIGKLKNLKSLHVANNQLTSLPLEIGNLKNLKTLILNDNQIKVLPLEIGKLMNLRELYFMENPLESPPQEILAKDTFEIFNYLKNQLPRPKIFISYVHENRKEVEKIRKALENQGIEVWQDIDGISPGKIWKDEIRGAIREGEFFLACFSKEFYKKDRTFMNDELMVAIEELRLRPEDKTWFIPVLLADCMVPDRDIGAGRTLRDLQWVELYKDWDDGIERIVGVILGENK